MIMLQYYPFQQIDLLINSAKTVQLSLFTLCVNTIAFTFRSHFERAKITVWYDNYFSVSTFEIDNSIHSIS